MVYLRTQRAGRRLVARAQKSKGLHMNRPGVFYVIVVALTIVLVVIGMALYACGVK